MPGVQSFFTLCESPGAPHRAARSLGPREAAAAHRHPALDSIHKPRLLGAPCGRRVHFSLLSAAHLSRTLLSVLQVPRTPTPRPVRRRGPSPGIVKLSGRGVSALSTLSRWALAIQLRDSMQFAPQRQSMRPLRTSGCETNSLHNGTSAASCTDPRSHPTSAHTASGPMFVISGAITD